MNQIYLNYNFESRFKLQVSKTVLWTYHLPPVMYKDRKLKEVNCKKKGNLLQADFIGALNFFKENKLLQFHHHRLSCLSTRINTEAYISAVYRFFAKHSAKLK